MRQQALWLIGLGLLLCACLFAISGVISFANGEIGSGVLLGAAAVGFTFGGHRVWGYRHTQA